MTLPNQVEVQPFIRRSRLRRRPWFFRVRSAGNHRIIAESQGYTSRAARDDAVDVLTNDGNDRRFTVLPEKDER